MVGQKSYLFNVVGIGRLILKGQQTCQVILLNLILEEPGRRHPRTRSRWACVNVMSILHCKPTGVTNLVTCDCMLHRVILKQQMQFFYTEVLSSDELWSSLREKQCSFYSELLNLSHLVYLYLF
jgi:hypothetical protein